MALILPRLYGITPHREDARQLFDEVEQALAGGLRCLQYRDKRSAASERLRRAQELLRLCRRYDSLLLINDDLELGLRVGADGVHLGQGDGSLAAARARLGRHALLGATCHGDLQLAQAAAPYTDYLAFGAFFASNSKPQAQSADVSILAAAAHLGQPRVAIGGISLDNGAALMAAGADTLAMIGAIFDAPDISQRCRDLLALCERPPLSPSSLEESPRDESLRNAV